MVTICSAVKWDNYGTYLRIVDNASAVWLGTLHSDEWTGRCQDVLALIIAHTLHFIQQAFSQMVTVMAWQSPENFNENYVRPSFQGVSSRLVGMWHLNKSCETAAAELLQSCLTLCDLMNCRPPCSFVHGILQARTLEWVAVPSSRGSS